MEDTKGGGVAGMMEPASGVSTAAPSTNGSPLSTRPSTPNPYGARPTSAASAAPDLYAAGSSSFEPTPPPGAPPPGTAGPSPLARGRQVLRPGSATRQT